MNIGMGVSAFKVEHEEEKELIMLLELTRHGARSPIYSGSSLLNTTWEKGLGELTNIGERQHYLQGLRLRKKYITDLAFLSDTFDPRFMHIRSTDVNRTIMSAHSQMLGLYPTGYGPKFDTNDERRNALPPFSISDGAQSFSDQFDVLFQRYDPVPVHVSGLSNDHLLRGYSTSV